MQTKVEPRQLESTQERKIFTAMLDITKEGGLAEEGSISVRTGTNISEIMAYKSAEILTPNWRFYEQQIIEAARIRALKRTAEKITHANGLGSQDIATLFQDAIDNLGTNRDGFEIVPIREVVDDTERMIMERSALGSTLIGLPSGIKGLDEKTFGFQDRRLYYIGARPSLGKTALLLNFIANCPASCGVLSAESGKEELVSRLLARDSIIDSQRLTVGMFRKGEEERFHIAADHLREDGRIYIYDEPNMQVDTAIRIARNMKRLYDIKILFVDYLQHLAPNRQLASKPPYEQIAYASKQMKNLARILQIPVVVAAQLKRDSEGMRPTLADFSDSTQIERDGDVCIMIHHDKEKVWLLVEKNRDGRTGDVAVTFHKSHVLFTDREKGSEPADEPQDRSREQTTRPRILL
jgi:replicative DNA helicase